MKTENQLLCHAVKAVCYRFGKVVTSSNETFGDFKIGEGARTPCEIINHMCDLAVKAKTMMEEGHFNCPSPSALGFKEETDRLMVALDKLKEASRQHELDLTTIQKLLQGPIIDMATHVGQLAMLSGLHGSRIPKQNYFDVDL